MAVKDDEEKIVKGALIEIFSEYGSEKLFFRGLTNSNGYVHAELAEGKYRVFIRKSRPKHYGFEVLEVALNRGTK